jgi:ABC-2 type transport system ATP-binding protein
MSLPASNSPTVLPSAASASAQVPYVPAGPPAVRVHQLIKDFDTTALRKQVIRAVNNVSLEVQEGEVYGLIGPNGSGKSTTMKVALGLLKPTSGSCAIFGRDSSQVDSRQDVGFLPENPYFYKHLTGAETLSFYGQLCGMRGRVLQERIQELLHMVDLEHARDRRLGGYSKGMLQRIGLAQAIIHRPRLVVLDEPTAGVDPAGSRKIRDLILALKTQGISVILSSHLLEQVQEVCDRVGIIFRGDLVREGRIEDILAVENQTELVLENASPGLLEKIRALVQAEAAAHPDGAGSTNTLPQVLRHGRPRTTLERLFLEVTDGDERGERHSQSS